MKLLVANIGSTSFKYKLLDMALGQALAQGRVERIGQAGGDCPDYESAIGRCIGEIVGDDKPLLSLDELAAIGFKAVHAGPFGSARLIDGEVLGAMEEYAFFAPAHNPPYIAAMRAFRKALPDLPLVAVFETAFFDDLDEATTTYAVPYSWRKDYGVRRYGFHGASHRAASERAQAILGRGDLRHISCHLGGSSSLAAIRSGRAIDTSFGVSPQSGLPHNSRVGDLDVFAVLYMMKRRSLGVDEVARILAGQSGLSGISGGSGDVRDLTLAAAAGDRRARLALDMFVGSARHYLGAFLVKLGGLDVITFSGGIGENSADVRAAVCEGLSDLGIELDLERNVAVPEDARISTDQSGVIVLVIPADEEMIVARETAALVEDLLKTGDGCDGMKK
ncbi:MAG: acetate/propionate family kinase [Vicinamibacteria bacterium]|nr:acetate/propionate family kinase [Vicinamibacteria bacterium]